MATPKIFLKSRQYCSGIFGLLWIIGTPFAMFGFLWCICKIFSRLDWDILNDNVVAMAPINLAADGALAVVVGGAEVAVAPPDFRKTVNAMSARGA